MSAASLYRYEPASFKTENGDEFMPQCPLRSDCNRWCTAQCMSKAAMQREHTTQQIQTYSQTTQTNQQIKTCNKDTKKQRSKETNRNKPRHSERQHLTASGANVVLLCYSSLLFACFFLCLFVFGWIYCLCLFFLLL
jgi:hypothetical protein